MCLQLFRKILYLCTRFFKITIMADFFLRTKRTEGMASLYTRVKKRNPEIKWEYVNTGITVDIEAWTKAKKSIVSWSKYIREEGKEVNEKLDKVAQTIELLFKEGRIKSNDDKAILENEVLLIANNDALKVREEVAERQRRQREFEKKERIRQQKDAAAPAAPAAEAPAAEAPAAPAQPAK